LMLAVLTAHQPYQVSSGAGLRRNLSETTSPIPEETNEDYFLSNRELIVESQAAANVGHWDMANRLLYAAMIGHSARGIPSLKEVPKDEGVLRSMQRDEVIELARDVQRDVDWNLKYWLPHVKFLYSPTLDPLIWADHAANLLKPLKEEKRGVILHRLLAEVAALPDVGVHSHPALFALLALTECADQDLFRNVQESLLEVQAGLRVRMGLSEKEMWEEYLKKVLPRMDLGRLRALFRHGHLGETGALSIVPHLHFGDSRINFMLLAVSMYREEEFRGMVDAFFMSQKTADIRRTVTYLEEAHRHMQYAEEPDKDWMKTAERMIRRYSSVALMVPQIVGEDVHVERFYGASRALLIPFPCRLLSVHDISGDRVFSKDEAGNWFESNTDALNIKRVHARKPVVTSPFAKLEFNLDYEKGVLIRFDSSPNELFRVVFAPPFADHKVDPWIVRDNFLKILQEKVAFNQHSLLFDAEGRYVKVFPEIWSPQTSRYTQSVSATVKDGQVHILQVEWQGFERRTDERETPVLFRMSSPAWVHPNALETYHELARRTSVAPAMVENSAAGREIRRLLSSKSLADHLYAEAIFKERVPVLETIEYLIMPLLRQNIALPTEKDAVTYADEIVQDLVTRWWQAHSPLIRSKLPLQDLLALAKPLQDFLEKKWKRNPSWKLTRDNGPFSLIPALSKLHREYNAPLWQMYRQSLRQQA